MYEKLTKIIIEVLSNFGESSYTTPQAMEFHNLNQLFYYLMQQIYSYITCTYVVGFFFYLFFL